MTIVIDASVAPRAAIAGAWPAPLASAHLVAPSLLWSEAASAIRQQEWRGGVSHSIAEHAIHWLAAAAIEAHDSRELIVEAHALARQLGWAKPYDAEYVVLARRHRWPLLTLDARLARTASGLVTVLAPHDLR